MHEAEEPRYYALAGEEVESSLTPHVAQVQNTHEKLENAARSDAGRLKKHRCVWKTKGCVVVTEVTYTTLWTISQALIWAFCLAERLLNTTFKLRLKTDLSFYL